MKKQSRKNKKRNTIQVCVDVEFMPFTSKEARQEAYRTHAKLFLRAKKRMLEEGVKKNEGKG